ncbi:uncharacterized protein LTHEOB_9335 [Lasiodiplodia theobromae]|uniref:uncharacterized protein n=1 Tax=Lasiodiplodia theobromae TaxID=45133 RepID=UPI0015C32137|nr:uncharacterized protein LTHEOB_9335 [Lasiodiplodia theobromae]KAF4540239.1 hypothetical protein LTHEOB_9335 [Lasiodiplodia theobromae]
MSNNIPWSRSNGKTTTEQSLSRSWSARKNIEVKASWRRDQSGEELLAAKSQSTQSPSKRRPSPATHTSWTRQSNELPSTPSKPVASSNLRGQSGYAFGFLPPPVSSHAARNGRQRDSPKAASKGRPLEIMPTRHHQSQDATPSRRQANINWRSSINPTLNPRPDLRPVTLSHKALVPQELFPGRIVHIKRDLSLPDSEQGWRNHPAVILSRQPREQLVAVAMTTSWTNIQDGMIGKFIGTQQRLAYERSFCRLVSHCTLETRLETPAHIPILQYEGAAVFVRDTYVDCRAVRVVEESDLHKYYRQGTREEAWMDRGSFRKLKEHFKMLATMEDFPWEPTDQLTIRTWAHDEVEKERAVAELIAVGFRVVLFFEQLAVVLLAWHGPIFDMGEFAGDSRYEELLHCFPDQD